MTLEVPTRIEVRPVESFREQSAPDAHYFPPNSEGTRPAVFYANTHSPEKRPIYGMACLALREVLGGP